MISVINILISVMIICIICICISLHSYQRNIAQQCAMSVPSGAQVFSVLTFTWGVGAPQIGGFCGNVTFWGVFARKWGKQWIFLRSTQGVKSVGPICSRCWEPQWPQCVTVEKSLCHSGSQSWGGSDLDHEAPAGRFISLKTSFSFQHHIVFFSSPVKLCLVLKVSSIWSDSVSNQV